MGSVRINNLVIIADTHFACKLALCPPTVTLDEGGTYHISRFQEAILECWNSFHDEWVPRVTRCEPFILVLNGDGIDHRHHGATTLITNNLADQQKIAYEMLKPVVDKAEVYYHIRGTEAHSGPSGEEEEKLAKSFKGNVLDIGKSQYWGYSELFKDYKTMDIDAKLSPDFDWDICKELKENDYNYYELVLCNGMYEQLEGEPEMMINNIYKIFYVNQNIQHI